METAIIFLGPDKTVDANDFLNDMIKSIYKSNGIIQKYRSDLFLDENEKNNLIKYAKDNNQLMPMGGLRTKTTIIFFRGDNANKIMTEYLKSLDDLDGICYSFDIESAKILRNILSPFREFI